MTLLVGVANSGAATADSQPTSAAIATQFQAVASGTVDTLAVWTNASDAGTVHLALYADSSGTPTTRLSGDLTTTTLTANGFTTVVVSPGVAVTNGTFYWIASTWVGSGNYRFDDFAASGGTSRFTNSGTTTLNSPADWTANTTAAVFALQATGTTGSSAPVPILTYVPQAVKRASYY